MSEDFGPLITTNMQRIHDVVENSPTTWASCLDDADAVMESIEKVSIFSDGSTIDRQVWVLEGLQNLAAQAADFRNVAHIARWCNERWHLVLMHQSGHVGCLAGGPLHPYLPSPSRCQIHRREVDS